MFVYNPSLDLIYALIPVPFMSYSYPMTITHQIKKEEITPTVNPPKTMASQPTAVVTSPSIELLLPMLWLLSDYTSDFSDA